MGLFSRGSDGVRPDQVERLIDASIELGTCGEGPGDMARARATLDAVSRNSTPAERLEATRRHNPSGRS